MSRLYRYVGPPEIAAAVSNCTARVRVLCADDVRQWYRSASPSVSPRGDAMDSTTATFIVDENGDLWIADRRSEHVACARGRPVLSAGEMTLEIGREDVEVSYVTNQSTGYCPEPKSWKAVASALDNAGIERPSDFTAGCEFRRCGCGQINIVKNGVYECGVCESELPSEWNLA